MDARISYNYFFNGHAVDSRLRYYAAAEGSSDGF